MGLIRCQDVGVSLNLLTTLSDCNSFNVSHFLFSQVCCYLLYCSQSQFPSSLRCVQSFTFSSMEAFHQEDVFSLLSSIHLHKQVSVSSFLYVFGVTLDAITFSIKEEENLARQTSSKD